MKLIKQDNTSNIKNSIDAEKIIQRINKKKYGFENTKTDPQKIKKII